MKHLIIILFFIAIVFVIMYLYHQSLEMDVSIQETSDDINFEKHEWIQTEEGYEKGNFLLIKNTGF